MKEFPNPWNIFFFLIRWRSTSHPSLQSGLLTVCNAPSRSSEVRAPFPTPVRSPAICPTLHLYHRRLRTKVWPFMISLLSFNTFCFKANCISSGQIGETEWDQKVINYRFVREFSPLNLRVMLVIYDLDFITHIFCVKVIDGESSCWNGSSIERDCCSWQARSRLKRNPCGHLRTVILCPVRVLVFDSDG